MKRFILFWTFTVLSFMANAQNNAQRNDTDSQREPSTHVTATQAMDVGYAFMHTGNGSKSGVTQSGAVRKQAMQLVYTGRITDSLTRATTDCYYVFALQPKGFVIVAADNRVNPILGYSYDNDFVVENMPEHVRSWLGDYEKQIQLVTKSDHQAEPDIKTKWSRLKSGQPLSNTRDGVTVGPLLTTTWDQAPYYNALCPEDPNGPDGHVVTGCVATAMAQIINYWGYPAHGRGTHSYNSNYGTLTVNYDSTYYDYANMPDALTSTSTSEQINAVAQLMYHCGVAVNMRYTALESGSFEMDARAALINFFRFSPSLSIAEKDCFLNDTWQALIRMEIDANRPVLYGGKGSGGHAFVCDGYDDNNFFHFNFGWSGNGNGWYYTSAISPGYDYSLNQTALVGIVPDSTGNIILGQSDGISNFTVDEPVEFYHLIGHNTYIGTNYANSCNSTTIFVSSDTTKQLVADIISFEGQNVSIFDGNQSNPSVSLHEGYDNNLTPVVSTNHTIKILYQGKFFYNGFKLNISQEDSCRMVSNVVTLVDTTTIHLSWTENGNATQWEVEYGLKGFSHGNGTVVTANTTAVDISGLTSFREYDFYISPICGMTQHGLWRKITEMAEAKYWTDVVTSQPEGYVVDEEGNVTISSAEGLAWFSKLSQTDNFWTSGTTDRCVYLTADVNLGRYKWKPILSFSGVFDGQGHRIDSMYAIERNDNTAFFKEIMLATVKNIYLSNCYSKGDFASGLIYGKWNYPPYVFIDTIMNCFVSGKIDGGNAAPIIVHGCNTKIFNCASNCEMIDRGTAGTGGIVSDGYNGGGPVVIRNCYSASKIYSSTSMGCILGYGEHATIENCYGYLGRNVNIPIMANGYGLFNDNTWFNETDSGFYLVEPVFFEPDSQYYSNLKDALNAGVRKYNLEGSRLWVDDTAGINEGMPILGPEYIPTCPNIRDLSARNVVEQGGLCGVELSWTEVGDATAWEVKYHIQDSTDIVCVLTTNNLDTIWGLLEHNTYLFSVRPVCGSTNRGGWSEEFSLVVDRPYWIEVVASQPDGYTVDTEGNVTISSAEGLAWLISTVNGLNGQTSNDFRGKCVTLTQDVNIGRYKWTAINDFRGTFNGGNHHISDLYISELNNNQGLFGLVYGGRYLNIYMDNANVKGINNVGMLIGAASYVEAYMFINNPELLERVTLLPVLVNCHVQGTVSGENKVGGIAGIGNCEEINVCSSSGTVYAKYDNAGGLLGYAALIRYDREIMNYIFLDGSIRNCYSQCEVTVGRYGAGGLFGQSEGNVENCFAIGSVDGWLYKGGITASHRGGFIKNCYAGGTVSPTGYMYANGMPRGYLFGAIAGETLESLVVSNCYGLADPTNPLILGAPNPDYEGLPIVSETVLFDLNENGIVLRDSVEVAQIYYHDILEALNAWVDAYDTAGIFMHWVADTNGENNGFPKFEEIRYNTITLHVTDSTPYGSVSGGGTYANYESVIISAVPDYGYHVVWNDGNTDNPRTIKLTQDTSFTASFEKNRYSVVGTSKLNMDYFFDFEDNMLDDQWTFLNKNYVNRWCISALNDSSRALFISNDNGINNIYTPILSATNTPMVFAYTTLILDSGQYNYYYDWRCKGDDGNSFLRVALLPISEYLSPDGWSYNTLPAGAIALDGEYNLAEQINWTHNNGIVSVPVAAEYRMVYYWRNTWAGSNPPAAVDNIHLYNGIPEEENSHGYVLGSDTVQYLDTVVLTAVPNEGFRFLQWTDGNTDNPRVVAADADKFYWAVFECASYDIHDSIVVCDSYSWNGVTYTESGDYTQTFTAANGCDSVVTLHLTVNPSVSIEAYLTISENDLPFTYGDTTFMPGTVQSGDYIFNFTTADGCDSVIILHLTVETGINDYALNASMKVYPNPTKDVVNVQLTINNEQLDDVEVQLFEVYGRLLEVINMADARGASIQTTQIDLSRYAKGVYFVKAVSEGKVIAVRKVVKR